MTLAEKIQKLRKEKGLSQDQLALELGVSRQSVSKWELGDSIPDISKILQLADYFQVSTDYLLRDQIDHTSISEPSNSPCDDPCPDTNPAADSHTFEETDTEVPKKNPFQKAFKISLWITIFFSIFPFSVALFIRLFHQNGGRLGTTELLLFITVVFTTIVPVTGIITLIFWILKHSRK